MAPKKELSIEKIQELLDVSTTELLNFLIRDKTITVKNTSSRYTLEDSHSFIEIILTAKTEKEKNRILSEEMKPIQIIKDQLKKTTLWKTI